MSDAINGLWRVTSYVPGEPDTECLHGYYRMEGNAIERVKRGFEVEASDAGWSEGEVALVTSTRRGRDECQTYTNDDLGLEFRVEFCEPED